jgi:ACS family glucarate transporter-like MFS transporter
MAVCMPLGGWLSDRIYALFGWRAARAGLAFTAMATSAGLLWIGVRATEPVWIVTWLSLAMGVLGMTEGLFWVTAVEVGGNRGGLSAGIFNAGGNLGGVVAPVATPLIAKLGFGWENAISVASVVCLLGAICWLWIDHRPLARTESDGPIPVPPG